MSTRCEGLTATDLRGHPYYVGKTKHVKLLQGDVGVGDRQGSRSVFLLLFVRLSVDVTYFIPLHDYNLASSGGLKSFVGAKDLIFIVMILYENLCL